VADFSPAKLQLVKAIPVGRGWFYEPKLDGYRGLLARLSSGYVRLTSRNGKDLTRWFPEMVRVAESLPLGTVIDGEVVKPIENGVNFSELQSRLTVSLRDRARVAAASPVALVAFDVLVDRGEDATRLTLT